MPKLVPMSFFHNPAPILNTNGFHSFKSYSNQLRTYRMFFETFVPAQVHGQVVETFETLNNLTYSFYDKKFGIKEFCRVWLLQCLCPLNIQSNRSLGQSEDSAIFPLILLVHVLAYVVSPNYSPSLTRHLAGQRLDLYPQLLQNWAPAITICKTGLQPSQSGFLVLASMPRLIRTVENKYPSECLLLFLHGN